ncbi:CIS tube protein [Kribbella pratensis]|uniref:Contractile injection system tube protein N-terminal domain-containing protein n=1 Tax=Kribbella pratensis TaxID=2512112 RepID=A0A4R8CM42_9ACTN|nr:hypothetical protein [Kribbella pratensis]TDW77136.1 hypothetical protein EV653_2300 [Kribbella pratensis]
MSTAPAEDNAPKGAVLDVLDKKGKATKTIPVQFNPASLRLTMSNNVDGGTARGRQAQQYNGSSSTQLHVELEFDTADEGTTDAPVDVRTRTSQIAQFVLPGDKGSKQAPPRVQFRWGSIAVAGVMTNLVEELDFFSADGIPLRAKTTIDIKEQDPKFEALTAGAGANPDSNAQPAGESDPDAAGNGPGSDSPPPTGPDTRTADALDGESAADFLARNDQPPEAWRAIAGLVGDALSLAAGASIDFSASLDVGVGIGISAGFEAELDVSVGAQAGLDTGSSSGGVAAGFALAAAGGLSAAIEQSAIDQTTAVANESRAAFGTPIAVSSGTSAAAAQRPAAQGTSAQLTPAPRPLPPRADPRATSYGRGVPLRDRVTPDASLPGAGGWTVIAPLRPPEFAVLIATTDCGCGCSGTVVTQQPSTGATIAVATPAPAPAPAPQAIGMWGRSRPRKGCCG